MKKQVSFTTCLVLFIFAGCSKDAMTTGPSTSSTTATVDGSRFLLDEEPKGATGVIKVREEAKDGDEVVLVGRIGGSANPWIEGRAAFFVVDDLLKACSDIPGSQCPIPWDYCCETDKLPNSMVLVKVVDGSGSPFKADSKQLLDVKELSTVVIKGKAQRDNAGNLTVLANGVYVKKK